MTASGTKAATQVSTIRAGGRIVLQKQNGQKRNQKE